MLANIKKEISDEEIRSVIRQVELDPDSKKSVRKYSLGMRQRLGIAQAIMEKPEVLILDEPFNGLDRNMSAKIRDLLCKEKEKGTTILLVSHNEKDIQAVCDRFYEIDAGELI